MTAVIAIPGWSASCAVFAGLDTHADISCCAWTDVLGPDLAAESAGHLGELGTRLVRTEEPVILVGWSLGGQLALSAALRWPRAVAGLVLLATTPRFVGSSEFPGAPASALRAMQRGLQRDPEQVRADFWQRLAAPQEPATARAWQQWYADTAAPDILATGLDWLRTTDLRADLATLTVPTVCCHGADDAIIPCAAGRALAAAMPRARFVELTGGHAVPLEHPQTVITAIDTLCHDH